MDTILIIGVLILLLSGGLAVAAATIAMAGMGWAAP
jgi:hypothetical protein